jgi:hypothetical protein
VTGRDLEAIFELLDPVRHDRAAFSCGVAQVDNFLRRTANKLASAGNLRVVVLAKGREIIGFYALNAHAVDYRDLPKRFARSRPGHGLIPVAYVSMIGVDLRYAGKGYGRDLMVNALRRIGAAADAIGIAMAIIDILDDGDAELIARRSALYTSFGFEPIPGNPLRLILPVDTIRQITHGLG